jgi:hypothetical protein
MQPEVRKPSGKAARPYHSARRAQAAADTRATILATAMQLMFEGRWKTSAAWLSQRSG